MTKKPLCNLTPLRLINFFSKGPKCVYKQGHKSKKLAIEARGEPIKISALSPFIPYNKQERDEGAWIHHGNLERLGTVWCKIKGTIIERFGYDAVIYVGYSQGFGDFFYWTSWQKAKKIVRLIFHHTFWWCSKAAKIGLMDRKGVHEATFLHPYLILVWLSCRL